MSGLCLWVSGSYLEVSGRCLGEFRCHINHKQLNISRHIKLLPLLPVASNEQKSALFSGVCGVSGRCLEGVLMVSEWIWVTLDTVWGAMMPNQ